MGPPEGDATGPAGEPPVEPPAVLPDGPGDPEAPGDAADPAEGPSTRSAVLRGRIENRRSVAVGYGRFTMPVTVAVRPAATVVASIPLPASPMTGIRTDPTRSSACQRSPERCTSSIVPRRRTRRHSVAGPGATESECAVGVRDPSATTASARRRGAPHALPTVPVTRTRRPVRRAASGAARYSSIAPVASSMTRRRPVASSSVGSMVTTPCTITSRPSRTRAAAIVRKGGAAGVGCALGLGCGVGVGRALGMGLADGAPEGEGEGTGTATTSARSRSQRR